MRRRRFSKDQWRAWISEQPSSGLSIVAFCHSIGVSANSFYRWRDLLGSNEELAEPFVPVSIGDPTMEIELPGGAVLRVPNDEASLRRVIRLLLEVDTRSTDESA